jgi:hypothetical protein
MKRFLAFVGLKIVEIAAIVYVPYWIGLWLGNKENAWLSGTLILVLSCFGLVVIVFFFLLFINLNWKWTHNGESIKWIGKILGEE